MAHATTMPHHIVGKHRVVLFGEERGNVCFDLVGILLAGPTKSPRKTPEVRIDGDPRDSECISEHHIGRLPPHTRQSHECVEISGNFPTEVIAQALSNLLDGLRLLPEEARRRDERFQLLATRCRITRGIGVSLEQGRRHLVHSLIGALSTQHSSHEQFQRRSKVELAMSVRVGLGEDLKDLAGLRLRATSATHAIRVCVVLVESRSASLPPRNHGEDEGLVSGRRLGWYAAVLCA